jgi:hypothetical protein
MKRPFHFKLPSESSPNGNAYGIIATWQRKARSSGWTRDECRETIDAAISGDYAHLRATLKRASEGEGFAAETVLE